MKDAGIGCPALSLLSIPAISHFRKSSRRYRTTGGTGDEETAGEDSVFF
jgi:hypothetical protein